ncbi:MAG TPA: hypothetical protein VFV63_12270, partial [Ilumatobacteraceae bacterium]|nr:hypothetical protein [Ilumatobacteraceae bacterium]
MSANSAPGKGSVMAVYTPRRSVAAVDAKPAAGVPGVMLARLAALGGAVFFVLVIINVSFRSGAPSATDSGQSVFDYVAQHHGRLQLGAVLTGLAMSAALLWVSGLFRALRRAEDGLPGLAVTALAGGILAAASTAMTALIQGTMATRIDDLGPAGVRVWWTMYLLSTGATLLGLLVLIGATAIVCLQRRLFETWFAVTSAVLALASVVGAFTIGYVTSGIQAVGGIAILLDSVWILLVSVRLWRTPELAVSCAGPVEQWSCHRAGV